MSGSPGFSERKGKRKHGRAQPTCCHVPNYPSGFSNAHVNIAGTKFLPSHVLRQWREWQQWWHKYHRLTAAPALGFLCAGYWFILVVVICPNFSVLVITADRWELLSDDPTSLRKWIVGG
ncbi:hypothetical protein DFJ73DRAFT_772194 [Zopfochytrium polystomum]|nr:hypothetical protein DFJ73DRAFT_772194 [Zopfochytrium polystomum]